VHKAHGSLCFCAGVMCAEFHSGYVAFVLRARHPLTHGAMAGGCLIPVVTVLVFFAELCQTVANCNYC